VPKGTGCRSRRQSGSGVPGASRYGPFFTYFCGRDGQHHRLARPQRPVEVLVRLEDGGQKPLTVDALSVTLSNPDKGIAPLTAKAGR